MILDDDAILHPQTRAMLTGSVLEPFIADYRSYLRQGRYARNTQRVYLCCVAHFARWLGAERIDLNAVTEEAGKRFVTDHLPRCECPPPVRRTPHEIKAALVHLHRILQAHGAVPVGHSPSHLEAELAAFDRYMDALCGLAASTRRQRVLILARFLVSQFGSAPVDLKAVSASDIRRFVLESDKARSTGTINVIAGALRCYLRCRTLAGQEVGALAAAVPRAANWRLAALPDVFSQAEVDQLLASCGNDVPSGKRAYAMIRCLVDLGLRSSEVARLRLDDIDWQAGTLRVAKGKSRRADLLPLPPATGHAIADYLKAERPQTANRAVFVRHVAPFDQPIKAKSVRNAVIAAYRRCGWTASRIHVLRHSMASRLLHRGTPLKEIADLLRHRSLDTVAIYAKVDLVRLAAVALPWPGRTP